ATSRPRRSSREPPSRWRPSSRTSSRPATAGPSSTSQITGIERSGATPPVFSRRARVASGKTTEMELALRIVHLLAAVVWVGGTVALVFVAVPPVQKLEWPDRGALLRQFGR